MTCRGPLPTADATAAPAGASSSPTASPSARSPTSHSAPDAPPDASDHAPPARASSVPAPAPSASDAAAAAAAALAPRSIASPWSPSPATRVEAPELAGVRVDRPPRPRRRRRTPPARPRGTRRTPGEGQPTGQDPAARGGLAPPGRPPRRARSARPCGTPAPRPARATGPRARRSSQHSVSDTPAMSRLVTSSPTSGSTTRTPASSSSCIDAPVEDEQLLVLHAAEAVEQHGHPPAVGRSRTRRQLAQQPGHELPRQLVGRRAGRPRRSPAHRARPCPRAIRSAGTVNSGSPPAGQRAAGEGHAERPGARVGQLREPRRPRRRLWPRSAAAPATLKTTRSPATPRRRVTSPAPALETSSVTRTCLTSMPSSGEALRRRAEVQHVAGVVAVAENSTPPPRSASRATAHTCWADGEANTLPTTAPCARPAPDEPGEGRVVPGATADDDRDAAGIGRGGAGDAAGHQAQQVPVRRDEPLDRLAREVRRLVEDAGHGAAGALVARDSGARLTWPIRSIRAITWSSSRRSKTFFQSSLMMDSRP